MQPAAEQTRRVTRSRAYSGPGFGPRSFDCLGISIGISFNGTRGPIAAAPIPPDPLATLGSAAWWVRADDPGITIATGVSLWPDKTGNIVSGFAQAGGTAQPLFVASGVNGRPTVRGDGINDRLVATFNRVAPGTQPFYLWFLLAQVGWTNNAEIYTDSSAGTAGVLFQSATTPRLRTTNGVNTTQNTGATIGAFKFIECYFSNSTSDYLRIGSTAVNGVSAGNTAGSGTASLFGLSGGTFCSNVEIAEAGCFLGTPTGTGGLAGGGQRAALAQYMSDLYGASVLT